MSDKPTKRPLQTASRLAHDSPVETFGHGDQPGQRLLQVPIEQVHPNPRQPRQRFDKTALASLAETITANGVEQPLIVRTRSAGGFEIVAGERRWRAAKIAGLTTIDIIAKDACDDARSLELALLENIAREDLTAIEEARAFSDLLELEPNTSKAELGRRLGRSRADITNTTRLLSLPEPVIDLIDTDQLTKGHGKALLQLTDPDAQERLATLAAEHAWSVRALEQRIDALTRPTAPAPPVDSAREATASQLNNALSHTSWSARVRPHPQEGYQVTLRLTDDAQAHQLAQLLGAPTPDRSTWNAEHPSDTPANVHPPSADRST